MQVIMTLITISFSVPSTKPSELSNLIRQLLLTLDESVERTSLKLLHDTKNHIGRLEIEYSLTEEKQLSPVLNRLQVILDPSHVFLERLWIDGETIQLDWSLKTRMIRKLI